MAFKPVSRRQGTYQKFGDRDYRPVVYINTKPFVLRDSFATATKACDASVSIAAELHARMTGDTATEKLASLEAMLAARTFDNMASANDILKEN